jgi:hypothetical protein
MAATVKEKFDMRKYSRLLSNVAPFGPVKNIRAVGNMPEFATTSLFWRKS